MVCVRFVVQVLGFKVKGLDVLGLLVHVYGLGDKGEG